MSLKNELNMSVSQSTNFGRWRWQKILPNESIISYDDDRVRISSCKTWREAKKVINVYLGKIMKFIISIISKTRLNRLYSFW